MHEATVGDGHRRVLRFHVARVVECVVCVDVLFRKDTRVRRVDARATNVDFGFARLVNISVDHRQRQLFVLEGSGTSEAPEVCGLVVARIRGARRDELGAHCLAP